MKPKNPHEHWFCGFFIARSARHGHDASAEGPAWKLLMSTNRHPDPCNDS
ncbi:hypothetical protein [Parapusillimonas granuli]|uniref:Uncharacterized protein n=1 Tax=Parapusillimonas granuli TaxID=380911 RepID=A0A853GAT7_9BURK|nr:hypothetical protein [Parapusillimonas granuli]MBB5214353.1 hypothetical protein [Parapusillimonas granuli]NYT51886.1 hypothetical protein [Parapusillimonas granuli]